MPHEALTTKQAAKICGLAFGTLARWRVRGCGPRYVKLGKAVRYRREDVEAWLDERSRLTTHDDAAEIEVDPSKLAA